MAQNRGKFSDEGALKNMFENYGLISLKDDHIEVKMIANVFKVYAKQSSISRC